MTLEGMKPKHHDPSFPAPLQGKGIARHESECDPAHDTPPNPMEMDGSGDGSGGGDGSSGGDGSGDGGGGGDGSSGGDGGGGGDGGSGGDGGGGGE